MAVFERQKDLLDGRLAKQYSGSERLRPKSEFDEEDGPLPAFRGNYKGEFLEVAKAAARKHNIPEDLFLRLVQQESGWNAGAVSPKGAMGLAQLMGQRGGPAVGYDVNPANRSKASGQKG